MAGNIIPAIATTNAIISGVIVMQALNILNGNLAKCKTVSCILDIMSINKQLLGSFDKIPGWTHVFTVAVDKYIGRLTKATVAKHSHENIYDDANDSFDYLAIIRSCSHFILLTKYATNGKLKCGIKQIEKGHIFTVKR